MGGAVVLKEGTHGQQQRRSFGLLGLEPDHPDHQGRRGQFTEEFLQLSRGINIGGGQTFEHLPGGLGLGHMAVVAQATGELAIDTEQDDVASQNREQAGGLQMTANGGGRHGLRGSL